MKATIAGIILFGLAFWLHGQNAEKIQPETTGSVLATGTGGHVELTALNSSVVVFTPASGKEVLRVSGLAEIRLGNPSPYMGLAYERPEKPEAVSVVLTTKDGKEWRAKWTSVQ